MIKKIWSRALLQKQQDPKYSVTDDYSEESETGDGNNQLKKSQITA